MDDDIWVELTRYELQEAIDHGRWLYAESRRLGIADRVASPHLKSEEISVLGAIGEQAVSRALGIPWRKGINEFREPDLGHNIGVRLLTRDHYRLPVRSYDKDSRRMVGVVRPDRLTGLYRIPGWINAIHGKRPEFLQDPNRKGRPYYLVPQERLHRGKAGLELLLALIRKDPEDLEVLDDMIIAERYYVEDVW